MDPEVALEEPALGETSLEEGTKVVSELLRDASNSTTASKIYHALSSWTWKTLDTRRRGEDLAGWMELLNRVSAAFESSDRDLSLRIETFAELVQMSLSAGRMNASEGLPRGKHALAALAKLLRAEHPLPRRQLLRELRLKPPHLSNVMGPLQDRGLVERQEIGREVTYCLTKQGVQIAIKLDQQAARRSVPVKTVPDASKMIIGHRLMKGDYMSIVAGGRVKAGGLIRDQEQETYPRRAIGRVAEKKTNTRQAGGFISADRFPVDLAVAER